MAARENQGLQIALIIFVILSIATSVTTYLGFTNFNEAKRKAEVESTKAQEATAKAGTAEAEVAALKIVIGSTDDVKTIRERLLNEYNTEYVPLGLGQIPDEQKSQSKVISEMKKTLLTYMG